MKKQHSKPCAECPWRRTSCRGWLGPETGHPEVYIAAAHSDEIIECHLSHVHECAGAAIYRANVCKTTRHGHELHLPSDKVNVFSHPQEFIDHHSPWVDKEKGKPCQSEEGSSTVSAS